MALMRSIGIVGAGQAGIVLGTELVQAGYHVTIYSDKTPDEYLAEGARPAACLFGSQVALEQKLGLNFWEGEAPFIRGMSLDLCTTDQLKVFSLAATFPLPALSVDQRLKFSRGLIALEEQGAEVVYGAVTIESLDNIAKNHDLTVISVGNKSLINTLFPRDTNRSKYDSPKRNIFMASISGYDTSLAPNEDHIKSALLPGLAEVVIIPFFDKDAGPSKNIQLEAVPGGKADLFTNVTSAEEGLNIFREFIAKYLPWKAAAFAKAVPTSPIGWAKGAVIPTVRRPVQVLPSNVPVLGLGDAVITNDPLAAQGANNATRMAHFFAQKIINHADRPFDAEWLERQFDEFWEYGQLVAEFSNALLEPLTGFQQELILSAARQPELARWFFDGLDDPSGFFPAFRDGGEARRFLAEHGVTRGTLLGYKLGIMRKVIGHKVFGSRRAVTSPN